MARNEGVLPSYSLPSISGLGFHLSGSRLSLFVSSFGGPVSLTISAHRLVAKAYEIGGPAAQAAVITPIFRAYHEDELDISDPEVLADAAQQADLMSSREEVSVSRVRCQRFPLGCLHFLHWETAFQSDLGGSWSLN
jgi:hypothetical protein